MNKIIDALKIIGVCVAVVLLCVTLYACDHARFTIPVGKCEAAS